MKRQLDRVNVRTSDYVTMNLHGCKANCDIIRLAHILKENESDVIRDDESELEDRFLNAFTLFISLKSGQFSPWHLDRLNAVNPAFSISKNSTEDPVAIWYLCHDNFISEMREAFE